MNHKIQPVQVYDKFSQYESWMCAKCKFRLIVLTGFSSAFWHHWRKVEI